MTEEQKPEQPRSLRGFYIGLGLAVALLLGGLLAYKPLRLRYAIWRVRGCGDYCKEVRGRGNPVHRMANVWMLECLAAACEGNQQAMEAVLDHSSVRIGPTDKSVGYRAMAEQPELFLELLGKRKNQETLMTLSVVAGDCVDISKISALDLAFFIALPLGGKDEPTWAGELRKRFRTYETDGSKHKARVARKVLSFMRERFAKELAAYDVVEKDSGDDG